METRRTGHQRGALMRRLQAACVVVVVLLVQVAVHVRSSDVPRVVVTADLLSDSPYALRISVRSVSAAPIRLYTASLPWGNITSTVLVAVTASGRRLTRELPIDDPGPDVTELLPGQTAAGVIDLNAAFPRLATMAASEEVIVFWSYRLVTTSAERAARTGGGCSFEKTNRRCWNDTPGR